VSDGYLFLRFEPDAAPEQLAALVELLRELDDDAPGPMYFDPDGTVCGLCGIAVYEGGAAAYWHRPPPEVDDPALVDALTRCGLRGWGWFLEGQFDRLLRHPRPAHRFAFGGHPRRCKVGTGDSRLPRAGRGASRREIRRPGRAPRGGPTPPGRRGAGQTKLTCGGASHGSVGGASSSASVAWLRAS